MSKLRIIGELGLGCSLLAFAWWATACHLLLPTTVPPVELLPNPDRSLSTWGTAAGGPSTTFAGQPYEWWADGRAELLQNTRRNLVYGCFRLGGSQESRGIRYVYVAHVDNPNAPQNSFLGTACFYLPGQAFGELWSHGCFELEGERGTNLVLRPGSPATSTFTPLGEIVFDPALGPLASWSRHSLAELRDRPSRETEDGERLGVVIDRRFAGHYELLPKPNPKFTVPYDVDGRVRDVTLEILDAKLGLDAPGADRLPFAGVLLGHGVARGRFQVPELDIDRVLYGELVVVGETSDYGSARIMLSLSAPDSAAGDQILAGRTKTEFWNDTALRFRGDATLSEDGNGLSVSFLGSRLELRKEGAELPTLGQLSGTFMNEPPVLSLPQEDVGVRRARIGEDVAFVAQYSDDTPLSQSLWTTWEVYQAGRWRPFGKITNLPQSLPSPAFSTTRAFFERGEYRVRAWAQDHAGAIGTIESVVRVSGSAPEPAFIFFPKPGAQLSASRPVFFQGSVFDADEGFLDGASLVWSGTSNAQTPEGREDSISLPQGTYTIELKGIDGDNDESDAAIVSFEVLAPGSPTPPLVVIERSDEALRIGSILVTYDSSGGFRAPILEARVVDAQDPAPAAEWSFVPPGSTTPLSAGSGSSLDLQNLLSQDGTYSFRLTATDSDGMSGFDEITVNFRPEIQ